MTAGQHASGAFTCGVDFYADETLKDPAAAYDQMLNLGPVGSLLKKWRDNKASTRRKNLHHICL